MTIDCLDPRPEIPSRILSATDGASFDPLPAGLAPSKRKLLYFVQDGTHSREAAVQYIYGGEGTRGTSPSKVWAFDPETRRGIDASEDIARDVVRKAVEDDSLDDFPWAREFVEMHNVDWPEDPDHYGEEGDRRHEAKVAAELEGIP